MDISFKILLFLIFFPNIVLTLEVKSLVVMLKKSSILLVGLSLLVVMINGKEAKAQDPEFTQFYSNPIYLNPALAGVQCPRITANARNQWTNVPGGSYQTYSFSFDQQSYLLHGGLGLLVTEDITGGNTLNTFTLSAIYTYVQSINRTWHIRAGFQFTFMQRALDVSGLTYGDMIDARRGFVLTTNEPLQNDKIQGFDISTGLLASNENFFIGGAVHHLLEPDEGFLSTAKVPMKYTGHAGAKIPLYQSSYSEMDDFVSPNVIYRRQGTFNHLNFGLYLSKGPIVGGIWYRGIITDWESNDSFIFLAGVKAGTLKLGYSYDMTISKLGIIGSGGSHEFSLTFDFNCRPPKRKFKPIACPDF